MAIAILIRNLNAHISICVLSQMNQWKIQTFRVECLCVCWVFFMQIKYLHIKWKAKIIMIIIIINNNNIIWILNVYIYYMCIYSIDFMVMLFYFNQRLPHLHDTTEMCSYGRKRSSLQVHISDILFQSNCAFVCAYKMLNCFFLLLNYSLATNSIIDWIVSYELLVWNGKWNSVCKILVLLNKHSIFFFIPKADPHISHLYGETSSGSTFFSQVTKISMPTVIRNFCYNNQQQGMQRDASECIKF